jgi:hypothetical protein
MAEGRRGGLSFGPPNMNPNGAGCHRFGIERICQKGGVATSTILVVVSGFAPGSRALLANRDARADLTCVGS